MFKVMSLIFICLVTLPVFCEPGLKYEVATINDVKPHQAADNQPSDGRYDVSVKGGDTVYVVLYTDIFGTGTVKNAAGRELLVHVGKNSITYNDILGQPHETPILSRKPVTTSRQSH